MLYKQQVNRTGEIVARYLTTAVPPGLSHRVAQIGVLVACKPSRVENCCYRSASDTVPITYGDDVEQTACRLGSNSRNIGLCVKSIPRWRSNGAHCEVVHDVDFFCAGIPCGRGQDRRSRPERPSSYSMIGHGGRTLRSFTSRHGVDYQMGHLYFLVPPWNYPAFR